MSRMSRNSKNPRKSSIPKNPRIPTMSRNSKNPRIQRMSRNPRMSRIPRKSSIPKNPRKPRNSRMSKNPAVGISEEAKLLLHVHVYFHQISLAVRMAIWKNSGCKCSHRGPENIDFVAARNDNSIFVGCCWFKCRQTGFEYKVGLKVKRTSIQEFCIDDQYGSKVTRILSIQGPIIGIHR